MSSSSWLVQAALGFAISNGILFGFRILDLRVLDSCRYLCADVLTCFEGLGIEERLDLVFYLHDERWWRKRGVV